MNSFSDYSIYLHNVVEIMAAICGSIYLRSNKHRNSLRVFVYYLWLIVVVEIIGSYTRLMRFNFDNECFNTIKNSVFCENTWLYNINTFLGIGLIGVFYSSLLKSKIFRWVIRFTFVAYSVFTILFFTLTDSFFYKGLPYDSIMSVVIICVYVILYFIELLRSDELLNFAKMPSFYISLALLLWYLCVTPLFIFDNYYRAVNTEFVQFRGYLLLVINILTYTCFSFGFIYPLYKKK